MIYGRRVMSEEICFLRLQRKTNDDYKLKKKDIQEELYGQDI
jgi:hypothetical protein